MYKSRQYCLFGKGEGEKEVDELEKSIYFFYLFFCLLFFDLDAEAHDGVNPIQRLWSLCAVNLM